MWSLSPLFQYWVNESWQPCIPERKMYQLVGKLNKLKRALNELNRERFSNVERQADRTLDKLCQCQIKLQKDARNITLIREDEVSTGVSGLELERDKFIKQKCKVKWLNYRDMNTKFFHNVIRARRNANKIFFVKDK